MTIRQLINIMKVMGRTIPCDMEEQLNFTYHSESKGELIKIGDMDLIHLIRAFNKRNPMSSKFLENFVDQFIDKSTKRLNNMEKKQNGY
tara:strand:- start:4093 stop:4359 length:267 start_codon:yes stop_codon:yes gene_type:complete